MEAMDPRGCRWRVVSLPRVLGVRVHRVKSNAEALSGPRAAHAARNLAGTRRMRRK